MFPPAGFKRPNMFLKRSQRGFTAVEIIVVIIIAGIAIAMAGAAINYSLLSGIQANTASRQIASDMRYAQRLAISDNKSYVVDFTFPSNYKIYESSVPSVIIKNVDIDPKVSASGDNPFTFYSDGSADFPASGLITVSDSKINRYVSVTRASGKVKESD